jgi:hypothetical protein
MVPRQNNEIPIPTSKERAKRVRGAHRDGASQLSKWRGKMKRPLVLATTLYGFILLSKLIDRPARRDIPASGGHARDAARCRCIDLSRRCAEWYFPVVLSFS